MSKRRQTILGLALAVIAAGLFAASLKLPLWQMRMEAPQYRDNEALRVTIYPNAMTGDLREISVLNQYIGVHIPSELPQLKWLPIVLTAGGVLGVGASLLPRMARARALVGVGTAVALALAFAAVQAQVQMYDIGHKRDTKTKLARVKDFTPRVLGTSKLAQFTLTSRLGTGSFLIGGALALQFGAAFVTRRALSGLRCCTKAGSQAPHTPTSTEVLV
jgi:copper chaperone NosL